MANNATIPSDKLKVSLGEDGKPKRAVCGDLARCRISDLEWLINAPFGQFEGRVKELRRKLKEADKAEKKRNNGGPNV